MSNLIGAKLKHLIARANLTSSQFALDFAKASGVRKPVIDEWLADERNVYGKNLEKLAAFWRGFFPSLTASHLLMPHEDFVRLLGAPSGGQPQAGIVLPIQTNPLSGAQLSALTGSYRLYRYALTARPTIVCEAV